MLFDAAPTRVLHVAKTGHDTTGDGSYARPYLTITKANSIAGGAGGAGVGEIRVYPGTYQEVVSVPRDNLTYRAIGTVVIDGNNKANKAFFTAAYSNITIIGFAAQNCAFAFDFRGGTNVRFSQCSVSNSLRGFYAIGAIRPVLSRCVVTGTTDLGAGFWLTSNTQDALIEGCEAYGCAARGFYANASVRCVFRDCYCYDQTGTAYGFEAEAAADDCQFVRCWFIGNSTTNLNGIIAKTSARVRMDGCVVTGCVQQGLYHKGATDSLIVNCVADACSKNIYIGANGATPSSGSTVRNCVIRGATVYGVEIETASATGATLDYNNYDENAVLAVRGVTSYDFAGWQALGYEAHGKTVDPGYAATAFPSGYALPDGNALIGAGVYLGGSDLTPDIGRTGSAWDGYQYI